MAAAASQPESLLVRLAHAEHLTPTERSLSTYFEETYPHLAMLDLDAIAREANASPSSVTRFVRKLGYEDFRSFSRQLKAEVAANFDVPSQRVGAAGRGAAAGQAGAARTQAGPFAPAMAALENAAAVLDEDEFQAAAALLRDDGRPLYLLAAATGHPLLEYFGLLLRYYRGGVTLLEEGPTLAHELAHIPADAVLLASAFDRHSKAVQTAMRHFRDGDRPVILITNRPATPLRRYASHVLVSGSHPAGTFKSRVGLVALLEALLAACAPEDAAAEKSAVEGVEQILDELDVFISPARRPSPQPGRGR